MSLGSNSAAGDADDQHPTKPPGVIRRTKFGVRSRIAAAEERAIQLRREIPAVDAGWEAFSEDLDIGGPLISGAVAFRMFLWLLPFTMLSVVGFGLLADASGSSAEDVAQQAGVRGLAALSISSATSASTTSRWLLMAVGLIALISTSSALAKVLWRSHELAWRLPRVKPPSAIRSVGVLIMLAILAFGAAAAASRVRASSDSLGLVAIVIVMILWSALWLGASMLLPHKDGPWTDLLPGAILVGISVELLRGVTIYYVAAKVGSSSAIYGGLGAAATMLTWFYLVARTTVASAVLNATLQNRRNRTRPVGDPTEPTEQVHA